MGCGASANKDEAAGGVDAPEAGDVDNQQSGSNALKNFLSVIEEQPAQGGKFEAVKVLVNERAQPAGATAGSDLPFLRVVLPSTVYDDLSAKINAAKGKGGDLDGIQLECLNEDPRLTERVCDVKCSSADKIIKTLAPLTATLLKKHQEDAKARAARLKELEEVREERMRKAAEEKAQFDKDLEAYKAETGKTGQAAVIGLMKKKKADADAAKPKEDPLPKPPKADFGSKVKVGISDDWDRTVKLRFQWDATPSTFSEAHDPEGKNWESIGVGERFARGIPKKVELEYRRGLDSQWHRVPAAADGSVVISYRPETKDSKAYRGFQSRWVVDGTKYLTPIEKAPSLVIKLLRHKMVAGLLAKLPKDQRNIENIPNDKVKESLAAVENIVPMNTWDINIEVMHVPGIFIGGRHVMSVKEKIQKAAMDKLNDPNTVANLRRAMLKAPVQIVVGLLGAIGINLKSMIPDLDFFIPKNQEPKSWEKYEADEYDPEEHEAVRQDVQRFLNQSKPEWLHGLRVVLPPVEEMKRAIACKRPQLDQEKKVGVSLKHIFKKAADCAEDRAISAVVWPADNVNAKITVKCKKDDTDPKGLTYVTEEPVELDTGDYRYKWIVDNKPYFDGGVPIEEDDDNSYMEFKVQCRVVFGIGVPV